METDKIELNFDNLLAKKIFKNKEPKVIVNEKVKEKLFSIMSASDFHIPYHDIKAIKVFLKLLRYIKPDILIIHEVLDFYSISKYNKDPRRKLDLQKDIDKCVSFFKLLRRIIPKTRIIMLRSNHDERLDKYLNSRAEELSQLRCLTIEKLLKLDDFKIEYMEEFYYKGVLWKHGNKVTQHSAYTAKAEFTKEGTMGTLVIVLV